MKTSSPFPAAQRLRRVLATISATLLLSGVCIQAAQTLVPLGAIWRFRDLGIDQGTVWRQTNFNDSAWGSGPSQLGFGDADEMTMINIGPMGMRYPTIYFRHSFVVTNREALTNLAVRLMRDDGGIVYLNGVEVFRSNMPDGPPQYMTMATSPVSGSDESAFYSSPISLTSLRNGTNIIAVEIHQFDAFSSDISFNLELLANTPLGNLPPVATLNIVPSGPILGSDEMITFNVTGSNANSSVSQIDLLQNGAAIRTLFTSSATFTLSNLVPGIQDFTARAIDSVGGVGLSAPIRVFIAPAGFQTQSVFFPQFPSSTGLVLQVHAHTSTNVLHLMQPSGTGQGGAWMDAPQGVVDGFMTEFSFRIYNLLAGGADGFALVIAGTPQPEFGSGEIHYSGITNSLAVEFDTWHNVDDGDTSAYHISVHTQGLLGNSEHESASIGRYIPAVDFSNGLVHRARILYTPGSFLVFLDNLNTPVLNLNVNLGTLLSLPNGTAWIGFTAGSGGSAESHDILAWSHTSFANVPPTISLTSPAQAIRVAPGTDVVLTANAQDANGPVLGVIFFDGSEQLGFVENAPYSLVWTNPPPGIHVVTALTADPELHEALSAPRVVEILPTNANVFLYPNFSAPANLLLQSNAAFVLNRTRLTPATSSQVGGLWLNTKQSVGFGFETVFQFQVSQLSSSGADGLAFVILGSELPFLGNAGAGLGYGSITNSLAVEFDMFQNPENTDFDANHIGIHSRGIFPNTADESAALARVTPAIDMSDGAVHTVVIRYDGATLRVYLDDLLVPSLEFGVNLGDLLSLNNGTAWVGFTSATGGEFENHDLLMWSFRSNVRPQVQLTSPSGGLFFNPTNLTVSATATDIDGAIINVEFFANTNSIGIVSKPPFAMTWTNPPAGTFSLTVVASDDLGVRTTSLPSSIIVAEIRLLNHIRQADGSVTLAFGTLTNRTYTIQYSADLVHWSNALPAITGSGGVILWQDLRQPITNDLPPNAAQRFYRVALSP